MNAQSQIIEKVPPKKNFEKKPKISGIQKRQIKTFLIALMFLAPSLIIFITFVFIPLIRSFILSSQLTDPIGRAVAFYGLENYKKLFATPIFLNSLSRSLLFVVYTVPSTLLISLLLALLGNLRLKQIAIFRMIFSLTIAVSAATASLIFMALFHPALGNINYILSLIGIKPVPWLISDKTALIGIAICAVWLQIGLNTVIMLAAMHGISEELYESAMIDGANAWNKFKSITLPMISPTLFFLTVIDVIAALQTFTQVHVMTSGGPLDSTNVIVYSIYREFYFNGKYGFAAAQAIMLFLIMLTLTIIQFTVIEKRVNYE
ncbi:MAG: glycerol-3-phosphate ABC transporter permease [Chloroflexi bacterium HGW-Chloroflexi-10]|nr:MAG: glycerol-3-phosphate ABC transporter permease [Chloroflexi bacterium HGW-Chloroflexi-10]